MEASNSLRENLYGDAENQRRAATFMRLASMFEQTVKVSRLVTLLQDHQMF